MVNGGAPDGGGVVFEAPAIEGTGGVADERNRRGYGAGGVGVGDEAFAEPSGGGGVVGEAEGGAVFGFGGGPEEPALVADLEGGDGAGGGVVEAVAEEGGGVGGGFGQWFFAVEGVAEVADEEGLPALAGGESEVFGEAEAVGDGVAFMADGDGAPGAAREVDQVLPINVVAIGADRETDERGMQAGEGGLDCGRETATGVADGLGTVFTAPGRAFEKLAEERGGERVEPLVGNR